jgi:hypothetical protein
MYNGQFSKGLIHVLIFAVLVSAAHLSCIFGIFIAAWVFYQSIEAYHTARAMRDGLPLPDPLGLNEVGNWLNLGGKPKYPGQPDAETTPNSDPTAGQSPAANAAPNPAEPSFSGYQPPFAEESQPPNAPPPSHCWRRKEPIGAIVLIALGLLFLLDRLDIFSGRLVEFAWPLGLIALGIWLIVRRIGDSKGDCK